MNFIERSFRMKIFFYSFLICLFSTIINIYQSSNSFISFAKPKNELNYKLISASKNGDINQVVELIKQGASVNFIDKKLGNEVSNIYESLRYKDGKTSIVTAANNGHLEIIKVLLANGANINIKGYNGNTALLASASKGDIKTIKFLVNENADLSIENNDNETALLVAFKQLKLLDLHKTSNSYEYLRIINELLKHKILINDRERYLKSIKFLLEKSKNLNQKLIVSIYFGDIDLIKKYISLGADVNYKSSFGNNLLTVPMKKNRIEITKFLLSKGVDINQKSKYGHTVLMSASEKGYFDLVKFYVDKGFDINEKTSQRTVGFNALMDAATNGNLEIVKYLVSKGADIYTKDNYGRNVFLLVAGSGQTEILKYFHSLGYSVNPKDGSSLLMRASGWTGYLENVKFLISKGANVNYVDKDGYTALIIASSRGNLEIVKYLISKGAEIEATDKVNTNKVEIQDNIAIEAGAGKDSYVGKDGKTALMEASRRGHLDVIKYLVSKGANINARNSYGNTPLIKATWNSQIKVIDYLLKQRTLHFFPVLNVNNLNNDKKTALDYARTDKVRELLLENGAKKGSEL